MFPHLKSAGIALAICLVAPIAPLVATGEGTVGQQPTWAQTMQDQQVKGTSKNSVKPDSHQENNEIIEQ